MRVLSLMVVALGILMIGCGEPKPPPEPVRLDHVVRVLMHEPTKYTLMMQDPNSDTMEQMQFQASPDKHRGSCVKAGVLQISTDVPPEEDAWAVYTPNVSGCGCSVVNCLTRLHIHSAQDLQGAGWNHGKHGQGQTSSLE